MCSVPLMSYMGKCVKDTTPFSQACMLRCYYGPAKPCMQGQGKEATPQPHFFHAIFIKLPKTAKII
uniref:Uncharacterized protein n=1 Tax=Rhizophora mucronata TaxID=61149 RepID=A0A2P2P103_RHIMU